MEKILLSNMVFYGFHGVYEYEREQGQRFYVDVEMLTDTYEAARTDKLELSVDYTAIFTKVRDIVENQRFYLIEALANKIAEVVLENELVISTTVRVRKPSAHIPGALDYVQAEVTRGRE